eukprot:3702723-Amphidinium_carterae.1
MTAQSNLPSSLANLSTHFRLRWPQPPVAVVYQGAILTKAQTDDVLQLGQRQPPQAMNLKVLKFSSSLQRPTREGHGLI